KGFVYVNKLGGNDSTIARAKQVNIHTNDGIVRGVTGHTAIHLQDKKNDGGKEPAWKDIYIDIGANSREEALEKVQVGNPITYTDEFDYQSLKEIGAGHCVSLKIARFAAGQGFELAILGLDLLNHLVQHHKVAAFFGGLSVGAAGFELPFRRTEAGDAGGVSQRPAHTNVGVLP